MIDKDLERLFTERPWEADARAKIRARYAQKRLMVLLYGIAFLTVAAWIATELVR